MRRGRVGLHGERRQRVRRAHGRVVRLDGDEPGQGYHCQTVSWGTGCEPGGTTCPGGTASSGSSGSASSSSASSGSSGVVERSARRRAAASARGAGAGSVFSPYKDTSINMNWNTNVISTTVSGSAQPLATDLAQSGGKPITLAFATGECGSENWGGVPGAAMASANVPLLSPAGVEVHRVDGRRRGLVHVRLRRGLLDVPRPVGVAEAHRRRLRHRGRAVAEPDRADLVVAHQGRPRQLPRAALQPHPRDARRNNNGSTSAGSLGSGVQDSFNVYGDEVHGGRARAPRVLGSRRAGRATSRSNLMTMDYGSPSSGVCVVSGGTCEMGQSAIQAAYNLHDHWGVPYSNIELTPMIGGNDASSEQFTLGDADTVAQFAIAQGLAGVHYWSYDRDVDCARGLRVARRATRWAAATRGPTAS